ncbi:MAG: serine kinase [Epulopiscium sp.]|nr:serine kinase [Candidatus Epulonipiscium sp.]
MTVQKIMDALQLTLVAGEKGLKKAITTGYVGDLLSSVMAHAQEGCVWLTIQGHLNIVAVASLVNISCIIVIQGATIQPDTIEKANEEHIPIFSTEYSAYEMVKKLVDIGVY